MILVPDGVKEHSFTLKIRVPSLVVRELEEQQEPLVHQEPPEAQAELVLLEQVEMAVVVGLLVVEVQEAPEAPEAPAELVELVTQPTPVLQEAPEAPEVLH